MKSFSMLPTIAVAVSSCLMYCLIQTTDLYSTSPTNRHFHANYYEARAFFQKQMNQLIQLNPDRKISLHSLPLAEPHQHLSIEVGLIRGQQNHSLLLHISGTHGVEAFAGAAIQSKVLANYINDSSLLALNHSTVFIHGFNPYGFANLRRVNENNVDLNRNGLTPAQFKEQIAKHSEGKSKHQVLYHLFNPTAPDFQYSLPMFYLQNFYYGLRYGSLFIRQALLSNYRFPESLFYGGEKLQQSYNIVEDFLHREFNIPQIKKIALIDVHTGLGPSGYDSIKIQCNMSKQMLSNIYTDLSHFESDTFSGYDDVTGHVVDRLVNVVFPHLESTNVLSIVQEFGTYAGQVFRALIYENRKFQHDKFNRGDSGEILKAAFYIERKEWQDKIVTRGKIVFDETQRFLTSTF